MMGEWIQDEFVITEISPEEMAELTARATTVPLLPAGAVRDRWLKR